MQSLLEDKKEIVDYAVRKAIAIGAEYAEATFEIGKGESYNIKNGIVSGAVTLELRGLRLRFLDNGYIYSLSTNSLAKESIGRLIESNRVLRGDGPTGMEISGEKTSAEYKISYGGYDSKGLQNFIIKLDRGLSKYTPIKSRYITAGFSVVSRYYMNSEGSVIESTLPYSDGFMLVTVESKGEQRQRNIQFGATKGIEYFETANLEEKALEDAKNMKKVIDSGINVHQSYSNIVISSEIAGIAVHESIGHPNEADRVLGREAAQAGTSYVTPENLGLRIGSEEVTICDDPTIKNSYGFYLYDDEGVQARKRVIVEKGLQKELLHNRQSAFLMKTHSNGAARSTSYSFEPIVRMANTYLEPGRADLDELIEEAGNGIYVKNFTEWNIDDTRSFSRYQGNEAYLIENGRIGKPVKNFVIETKTLDFWSAVALRSKDLVFYAGTCGKGEPEQGIPVLMGGPDVLLKFGEKTK
ncbi:MAG: TldD/PmbA family protein [Candidatus Micrarchaeia archaeon]